MTAVWSDFGGVLTPPIEQDTKDFCRRIGLPPQDFLAAMRAIGDDFGTDPMAVLDTPLLCVRGFALEYRVHARRYWDRLVD